MRLCGDSGLTRHVVWRQWSYKIGCVETVVLQERLCGTVVLQDRLCGTVVLQDRLSGTVVL